MVTLAPIYFGIVLLNALVFLSGKKNDAIALLSCVFYILFVIGKRYDGSFIAWDLGNYEASYGNMVGFETLEIGYKGLCLFANSLGLSFYSFYMILASTYLMVIFLFVRRIGGNLHLIIMACMLYFVLIHFDQLRNQCAFAALLLTVFPISQQFNKKRIILVFIGLAFASIFHISFVLYAIPLFFAFKLDARRAKIFLWIMIALIIVIKATSSLGFVDSIIQDFISSSEYTSDRYEKYTESNANLSFFAPLSIYLVLLVTLLYWNNKIIHKCLSSPLKMNVDTDIFLRFFLFGSLFVLLTTVNSVMYRYPRDLSFLAMMYLGIGTVGKLSRFKDRLVVFSGAFAACIGWFIFDIFLKGYWLDYLTHFFVNDIL